MYGRHNPEPESFGQHAQMLCREWVFPHVGVHGRAGNDRARRIPGAENARLDGIDCGGEMEMTTKEGCVESWGGTKSTYQKIVAQTVGDLRESVGVEGREKQDVGPVTELEGVKQLISKCFKLYMYHIAW